MEMHERVTQPGDAGEPAAKAFGSGPLTPSTCLGVFMSDTGGVFLQTSAATLCFTQRGLSKSHSTPS